MNEQELDSFIADLRSKKIDNDRAAIERLIQLLQSADWDTQVASRHVITEFADERALNPLIELVQEGNILTKTAAIEALGKIGGPDATNALVVAVEHRAVRPDALYALASIGGPQAVNTLIENLRYFPLDDCELDGDHDARNAEAAGLEWMGSSILAPLIAALNHENSNVRYSVAEILGRIGTPAAIPVLKAALDSEQDEENRDNLRRVVKKLEDSSI